MDLLNLNIVLLKIELCIKILNYHKNIAFLNVYLLGKIIINMKSLVEKDKKHWLNLKSKEIDYYLLKSIFNNYNFFTWIRHNAYTKLSYSGQKTSITHKCLESFNKKRFNWLTSFSRHIFLKLIWSGSISNVKRSVW